MSRRKVAGDAPQKTTGGEWYDNITNYDARRVRELRDLLKCDDDKENYAPKTKSEVTSRHVRKTAPLKDASAKTNAKVLAATPLKNRKALATAVVNAALKLLTTAARASSAEHGRFKSGSSRQPGPGKNLQHVATCASTALAVLRSTSQIQGLDIKVEQAVLALVAKLITLDLDAQAFVELCGTKQRLVRTGNPSNSTIASEQSISQLLILDCMHLDQEATRLAVNFIEATLRLLVQTYSAEEICEMCDSLRTGSKYGPAEAIAHLQCTGAKLDEVSKHYIELSSILSASSWKRVDHDQANLRASFMLRSCSVSFALEGSRVSPDVELHREDMLRSLRLSIKKLKADVTLETCQKCDLIDHWLSPVLGHPAFPDLQGTEAQLLSDIGRLALAIKAESGDPDKALAWTSKVHCDSADVDIMSAIARLSQSSGTSLTDIEDLSRCVQSGGDTNRRRPCQDLIEKAIKVCMNKLENAGSQEQKCIQTALCNAMLVCLESLQPVMDSMAIATSSVAFLEMSVKACSQAISCGSKVDRVRQMLDYLRQRAQHLDKSSDGHVFVAISHLYELLSASPNSAHEHSDPEHHLTCVKSAAATLRGLPLNHLQRGRYASKLLASAKLLLKLGSPEKAVACVGKVLRHLSEAKIIAQLWEGSTSRAWAVVIRDTAFSELFGALDMLKASSISISDTDITQAFESLPSSDRVIVLQAWVLGMSSRSANVQQRELEYSLPSLLHQLEPLKHPVRYATIWQAVWLVLAKRSDLRIPDGIDVPTIQMSPSRGPLSDTVFGKSLEAFQPVACGLLNLSLYFRYGVEDDQRLATTLRILNAAISKCRNAKNLHLCVYDHILAVDILLVTATFLGAVGRSVEHQVCLETCMHISTLTELPHEQHRKLQKHWIHFCLEVGDIIAASKCIEELNASPAAADELECAQLRLALVCRTYDMAGVISGASTLLAMPSKSTSRALRLQAYLAQVDAQHTLAHLCLSSGNHAQAILLIKAGLALLRSLRHLAPVTKPPDKAPQSKENSTRDLASQLRSLQLVDELDKEDSSATMSDTRITHKTLELTHTLCQAFAALGLRREVDHNFALAKKLFQAQISQEISDRIRALSLRLQCSRGLAAADEVSGWDTLHCDEYDTGLPLAQVQLALAEGEWQMEFGALSEARKVFDAVSRALPQPPAIACVAHSSPPTKPSSKTTSKIKTGTARSTRTNGEQAFSASAKADRLGHGRVCDVQISTPGSLVERPDLADLRFVLNSLQAGTFLKSDMPTEASTYLAKFASKSARATAGLYQRLSILSATDLAQTRHLLRLDVANGSLEESTISVPSIIAYRAADEGVERIQHDQSSETVMLPCNEPNNVAALLNSAAQRSRYATLQGLQPATFTSRTEHSSLLLTASILQLALSPNSYVTQSPVSYAWTLERPAIQTHQLTLSHLAHELKPATSESSLEVIRNALASAEVEKVSNFQRDYIDILPQSWTTISIGMNDSATELWLARYRSGETPFFLRIPMTRSHEIDVSDEPPFTYATARAELQDIISLSDKSCHNPPGAAKGGRSAWWADREALDERMHQLLVNMERIWLGGFKGVISLLRPQADVLARFRRSFDAVLGRHLPSRSKTKNGKVEVQLHSQVLTLLIGLHTAVEDNETLEEDVMDVLYYIVDILRWNGEPNAFDEIDFDAMAVECIDAMRAYEAGLSISQNDDRHLILRLDRKLHCFPWESMPCLQGLSISRVGSMQHVRERLMFMRRTHGDGADRLNVKAEGGAFILNPSGDLLRTEEVLGPSLQKLRETAAWHSNVRTKLDEQSFSQCLQDSEILTYFGHGSGTQYIRERAVQKLNTCSKVVWLMGCSSGSVTENGNWETTSVPLSYLMAGQKDDSGSPDHRDGMCMAVVATLWDVTDRDIDRFSMSMGEKWGLFAPPTSSPVKEKPAALAAPPKTPGKRGRAPPKTPAKTPAKLAAKAPRRNARTKTVEEVDEHEIQARKIERWHCRRP